MMTRKRLLKNNVTFSIVNHSYYCEMCYNMRNFKSLTSELNCNFIEISLDFHCSIILLNNQVLSSNTSDTSV